MMSFRFLKRAYRHAHYFAYAARYFLTYRVRRTRPIEDGRCQHAACFAAGFGTLL